jgi:hypothetical protein
MTILKDTLEILSIITKTSILKKKICPHCKNKTKSINFCRPCLGRFQSASNELRSKMRSKYRMIKKRIKYNPLRNCGHCGTKIIVNQSQKNSSGGYCGNCGQGW